MYFIILNRFTPGSVLTPDNRKWLDSQGGDKSPEMSRRLLIGQQSFVMTRDGTLIETPPSSVIAYNEKLVIITFFMLIFDYIKLIQKCLKGWIELKNIILI